MPASSLLRSTEPVVVRFPANLIVGNRQAFKHRVLDHIADGDTRVVLDASECGYIDASGLGVLVSCAKQLERAGGGMVLVGVHDDLRSLMAFTKIDTLFVFAGTIERAKEHFAQRAVGGVGSVVGVAPVGDSPVGGG